MRLQKYMAKCGVASRRKSEEIIEAGRVSVNGQLVKEMGYKVKPGIDRVQVDGQNIYLEEDRVYLLLNKPRGYITSLKDDYNEDLVIDLIDGVEERIFPVGRLDKDTSGLLLLTNDGDLTYKLTHPSFEVEKTYIALIEGIPNQEEITRFETGIELEEKVTAPSSFKILELENDKALVEIVIHEGLNRQVRRMCEAIGHSVIELKRLKFGPIDLGNLDLGKFRHLREEEVGLLKKEVERT